MLPASLMISCAGQVEILPMQDEIDARPQIDFPTCGLPRSMASPFYDQAAESVTHLLFGCVLDRRVWSCWWNTEDRLQTPDPVFVDW
jgi:hypothetical protein